MEHTSKAVHCSDITHSEALGARICNTLQHTATHCNTLQHTATHCNTLQHTTTHCNTAVVCMTSIIQKHFVPVFARHCNTLQQIVVCCNTLPCNATHCSTLQRPSNSATHLKIYNTSEVLGARVCVFGHIHVCIYVLRE